MRDRKSMNHWDRVKSMTQSINESRFMRKKDSKSHKHLECSVFKLFLDASTHLYRMVCPWVRGTVRSWLWENMVGNERERSPLPPAMLRIRQRVSDLSKNVQKCPKISQNIPKYPIETHRFPNGLVFSRCGVSLSLSLSQEPKGNEIQSFSLQNYTEWKNPPPV